MNKPYVYIGDYLGSGQGTFGTLQDDGFYLLGDGDPHAPDQMDWLGDVTFLTHDELCKAIGIGIDPIGKASLSLLAACRAVNDHLVRTFPPYPQGQSPSDKVRAAIKEAESATN